MSRTFYCSPSYIPAKKWYVFVKKSTISKKWEIYNWIFLYLHIFLASPREPVVHTDCGRDDEHSAKNDVVPCRQVGWHFVSCKIYGVENLEENLEIIEWRRSDLKKLVVHDIIIIAKKRHWYAEWKKSLFVRWNVIPSRFLIRNNNKIKLCQSHHSYFIMNDVYLNAV